MIKLSVNETKESILLARTRALILYISIWIFDFGPEKLSGLWRNGPLARYGKLGNSHWENHTTKRIRNGAQMTFLARPRRFEVERYVIVHYHFHKSFRLFEVDLMVVSHAVMSRVI